MSDLIVTIGVVASVAALVKWWWDARDRARDRVVDRFVAHRQVIRTRRNELSQRLLDDDHRSAEIPMLSKSGWVPDRPLPIDAVQLRWRSDPPSIDEARRRASRVLPRGRGRGRLSYSEAIAQFDRPTLFFDGPSYRLVDVEVSPDSAAVLSLEFTQSSYYEGLDTTEILAYEAARNSWSYRRWLADPFALNRRAALPGISTLTIRREDDELSFLMHERAGEHVGVAADTFHVVPAGEFQPIDISPASLKRDLRLWSTICREYAEEFLGHVDSSGRSGWEIDWDNEEPYASLVRGRKAGKIVPWLLGVALDPLTWKPEILTACVFESEVFDDILGARLTSNDEGTLIGGKTGIALTDEAVNAYLDSGRTLAAGAACLTIAIRNRTLLATLPESD